MVPAHAVRLDPRGRLDARGGAGFREQSHLADDGRRLDGGQVLPASGKYGLVDLCGTGGENVEPLLGCALLEDHLPGLETHRLEELLELGPLVGVEVLEDGNVLQVWHQTPYTDQSVIKRSRKASTSVSPLLSSSLMASTTSSSRRVSLLASVRAMRYDSLNAAGLPSSTIRAKVSRGILTASTLSTALTVADAPLSPSSPLSPTTVRPREASISARSLLPPPERLFHTSTDPAASTNRLPCSAPSSMMSSPGPKETGSAASANSSRSSSVRNSKNLTPCRLSSTLLRPLVFSPSLPDYMPTVLAAKRYYEAVNSCFLPTADRRWLKAEDAGR